NSACTTSSNTGLAGGVILSESSLPSRRVRRAVGVVAATACLGVLLGARASVSPPALHAQDKVDFTTQIEPILKEHCYECHGVEKGRGKLRLHVRDLALKGGATGPLLVPGNSAESYMVTRLLGGGDEDQMPLDKDPLPEEQIALIKRWIDEGAEWPAPVTGTGGADAAPQFKEHWAYVPPNAAP